MNFWKQLNKTLSDGQSTNVQQGLFFGVYTRRGEAGFWSNLQHPKGEEAIALKTLQIELANRG